jgi:hypothetical protein
MQSCANRIDADGDEPPDRGGVYPEPSDGRQRARTALRMNSMNERTFAGT